MKNKILVSGLIFAVSIIPLSTYAAPQGPVVHHPKMPQATVQHGNLPADQQNMMAMHHPMAMAEKLAAMETAIGIRSEQLNAWRNYTASFMDMMQTTPVEQSGESKEKPLFGEMLAERAIERGEKAKLFQQAAQELRKVLDAKQLDRLAEFNLMAMPPMDRLKKDEPHRP